MRPITHLKMKESDMSPSKAAVALVFSMSVFALILGTVLGLAANAPQAEMWNNECLKRSNETCSNVCKWSTTEDRCEGTNQSPTVAGLLILVLAFYAMMLSWGYTCLSEERQIHRASIDYASQYGFTSFLCGCGVVALFLEDLRLIFIGITMILVSVVLFFRFFWHIKSYLEFKVDAPDKF